MNDSCRSRVSSVLTFFGGHYAACEDLRAQRAAGFISSCGLWFTYLYVHIHIQLTCGLVLLYCPVVCMFVTWPLHMPYPACPAACL